MLKELNSMINISNFLNMSLNNMSINMQPETSSAVSKKLATINKEIFSLVLSMDVEKITEELKNPVITVRSTKELETVKELDKVAASGNKGKSKRSYEATTK